MTDDTNVVSFPGVATAQKAKEIVGTELIELLQELIAEVKEGRLHALACVLVSADHVVRTAFGGHGPFINDMVAGCEYLKDDLKEAALEPLR